MEIELQLTVVKRATHVREGDRFRSDLQPRTEGKWSSRKSVAHGKKIMKHMGYDNAARSLIEQRRGQQAISKTFVCL